MSLTTLAVSLSSAWNTVWPILFAILFFGIIIALHEFGHFITAKLFRMRVFEFSIGMGPALFKKYRGEKTKFFWTLAKEKRESRAEDNTPADDAALPEPEPVAVSTAGTVSPRGETVFSLRLFPVGGICALGEDEFSDDERSFSNKPAWKRMIVLAAGALLNIILGLTLICIMLFSDGTVFTNEISYVSDAVTAAEDSLLPGDEILRVDGTRVHSTRDLSYCLFYRSGETGAELTVKRSGETIVINNFLYDDTQDGTYFSITQRDVTFLNCGKYAVKETLAMTKLVWLSLLDMVGGKYGLDDISGPVGTINIVAETTTDAISNRDYSSILFILAFITVNIGIVNLLPLPALDGGRLFFCLVEIIFRKPIPKKLEAVVHATGLVLLLLLMALITFNDLRNLIVS